MAGLAYRKSGKTTMASTGMAEDLRVLATQIGERSVELENEIQAIEGKIYDLESVYLRNSTYGDVVRGWNTQKRKNSHKKIEVKDRDRLFSISSAKFTYADQTNRKDERQGPGEPLDSK